jgi:hypothetical protein
MDYTQLNDYARTAIQGIGAFGAGALALVAWKNFKVLEKGQRENLELSQQGQRSDRFTRAIDQLGKTEGGSPSIEIRLGGIYALNQLAEQHPKDYRSIVINVLSAYLRENSKRPAPRALLRQFRTEFPELGRYASLLAISRSIGRLKETDVGRYETLQECLPSVGSDFLAIARILARLTREEKVTRVDLADTYLRGTCMSRAYLRNAILARSHIANADFEDADLECANLTSTNWHGTSMKGANLRDADCSDADLNRAAGLTIEQIKSARNASSIKVPA